MKKHSVTKWAVLLVLSTFILGGSSAFGQNDDKSLAPYFFVHAKDATIDRLPLKSTSVTADIAGVIANVQVTQVYKNEGNSPLEAIYIFPASTRAAVYGMKMTIGERTITAKIDKREAARKTYEAAKQAGKSASLLEQQRPNVFQMNVANIMPGDVIQVALKYTELLVPETAQYEFVFPTVVGPRYVDPASNSSSEKWVANPYLHQGEAPTSRFDISVSLTTGLPLQQITCSSHKVDTTYKGKDHADVRLTPSERAGGNRDFILKYRLAGKKIDSGLILSRGENENFFLLMLQPPERVENIQLPPREYVFIVDVSGSMNGFPLDISKKVLRNLIGNLKPTDQFNVMLFAGGTSVLSETSLPANSENIKSAIHMIDNQHGGGGTRLLPALKRALLLPKSEGISRNIVIVTDGYVSVEKEAFDLIRSHLGKANVFTFGIGSSVNRYLLEGMARVGAGEPFVITKPDEAAATADKFRRLIQYPALTGITIDWQKFDVYDVSPAGVPDLLADRPVVVFGKWRGAPRGHIFIRGTSGEKVFEKTIALQPAASSKTADGLAQLWARHRIALLTDYNRLRPNDERVAEVTNLGLTYSLLTDYTSFVAVDDRVRNTGGEITSVTQPLPLPQGVSNYALSQPAGMAKRSFARPLMSQGFLGSSKMDHAAAPGVVESELSLPENPNGGIREVARFQIISTKGLSSHAAAKTIKAHMEKISRCLDAEKVNNRTMTISIAIDADGRVKKVLLKDKVKNGKKAADCLLEILKGLRFDPPTGTATGEVLVRFVLTR